MLNNLKEKLLNKFNSSEFFKNSVIMVFSSSIAQVLPILFYPIITRLYTPEELGIFQIFFSSVSLIGATSGLKYEAAIMLPHKKIEANYLFFIGILISFCINFILLLSTPILKNFLKDQIISKILWSFFLVGFILYLFNSTSIYLSRLKKYKIIGIGKIIKSTILVIAQIILGLLKNSYGLLIGFSLSYLIIIYYLKLINIKTIIKKINKLKIIILIKRYKNFPKFYFTSNFLDKFSYTLLTFLISYVYDKYTLGLYTLSFRLLVVPISLIGNSIGQVYYQEFTENLRYDTLKAQYLFLKTIKVLGYIFIPFYFILFFIAPPFFSIIFGNNWNSSGEFFRILLPSVFFMSIYSPVSMSYIALEKQKYYFILHFLRIINITIIFIIGKLYNIKFILILLIYSILEAFLYLIFTYLIFFLIKNKSKL